MNKNHKSTFSRNATVILLAILLFYMPSVLALFGRDGEPPEWMLMSVAMATLYSTVFCINYFLLVPATLFRNDRKLVYFSVNVVIIAAMCAFIPLWFETHGGLPGPRHHGKAEYSTGQYMLGYMRFLIRDSVMMVLAAALAYALRLSQRSEEMRRRELELEADRKRIELISLKAQLNPHFLFNTLNNIYSLIAISPERAQKALHDLSGMLRFMIYDGASSRVPLCKEARFISDYAALMRLRLDRSVRVEVEIPQIGDSGPEIAPLLFLTLVENAFKHLDTSSPDPVISIRMTLDSEWMTFKVINSCARNGGGNVTPQGESGVGLANVERQLKLLYPGEYTLEAGNTSGMFVAVISIRAEALNKHHPSDVEK